MRWMMAASALSLAVLLSGCVATRGGKQGPPLPPGAPKGLEQHTPQQSSKFEPVMNRYFYFRKQAVVTRDLEVLQREYPELKQGTDKQAAINAESDVIDRYRGLEIIDGDIEPEHYSRFLAHEDGDKAVLLVNGLELYLRQNFEDAGGQLQILLFLERRDGVWTVVKTDETTTAEYHQALH
jgi:hypothetical protein